MQLIPNWTDLRPFAAELWIVGTIVAVLVVPFFTRRPNWPCAAVTACGLLAALAAQLAVGPQRHASTSPAVVGMLVADGVGCYWNVLLLLFVVGVLFVWALTTGPALREGDAPEFFVLLLGATLGMS